jgi:CheY-like chemotaxis protein
LTNTNDKKVILAVDDSPENLDVLKSLLTPGYIVKAAINGMMTLKTVLAVDETPEDLGVVKGMLANDCIVRAAICQ